MFDYLFVMMGPAGTAGAVFAVLVGVLSVLSFSFGRCEELYRSRDSRV